ncbi:MAG: sodium:proton antiporter [Methanobacteriota archaeon]|nr:MAG: sodium:proton antiporter [Euryarchaeota archaeon]
MIVEPAVFVVVFAALLFAFSLVSWRISGTVFTAPMFFVALGVLLSPAAIDLLALSATNGFVLLVAEVALVITLFADAARIDIRSLGENRWLPGRLLLIGLPLTIGAGIAIATLFFTDLTLAEAGLIGAILAPTDAGLGQAIVNNPNVPVRIRQALNVESGLNDGGAIPFFFLFLAMTEAEAAVAPLSLLLSLLVEQIGLGAIVGLAIGFTGGWLGRWSVSRGWISRLYWRIDILALAIIAWLVADALGGSGFIAAFVGGLATAAAFKRVREEEISFAEAEADILNLAVFFIFGLVAGGLIGNTGWTSVLYAVLSLTIIRMVPVAISLLGARLGRESVLFMGWFGPRGLASIVLLLIAIDEAGSIAGMQTISMVVIATVLISVFAHGITANPAIRWYARRVAALPPDAPERKEGKELPTRQDVSTTERE